MVKFKGDLKDLYISVHGGKKKPWWIDKIINGGIVILKNKEINKFDDQMKIKLLKKKLLKEKQEQIKTKERKKEKTK